jgi:hypothetical protein
MHRVGTTRAQYLKRNHSIPAATCWIASILPILLLDAVDRALIAEILSSTACEWTSWRWRAEKARRDLKTAVADGVSLARVIRMSVFPSSMGS